MRLVTLIYNQNNPRLFSDHVNRLDSLLMAEILIYNIQLHLRNTDLKISLLSKESQILTTNYVNF